MEAKHTPEEEFNNSLNKVGSLYEEGKDCLNSLSILIDERDSYDRLFEVIREMRDISAVTLKENKELKQTNAELIEALEKYYKYLNLEDQREVKKLIQKAKGGE